MGLSFFALFIRKRNIGLKILHISNYYNEGWTYQENLLPFYQAKLGYDVTLVTGTLSYKHLNIKNRLSSAGTKYIEGIKLIRLPVMFESPGRLTIMKGLRKILLAEKPDIIFHHWVTTPSLFTAYNYKKDHPGVKLYVDSHSDLFNSAAGRWYSALSRSFYHKLFWSSVLKRMLKHIDQFYCITPWVIEFEKKLHKIPAERLTLLPPGADTENFYYSHSDRHKLRNYYNIPDNAFVLVTAGKLEERKNYTALVNAVTGLGLDDLYLIIIGTGDKAYEKKLRNAATGGRVIFAGWQNTKGMNRHFSAADAGIWPGSQSVLWQQAAAVMPVIIRSWPGVEYLSDYNSVTLLEKGDIDDISESITKLYEKHSQFHETNGDTINLIREELGYYTIAKKSLEQ